ncbi:peptidase M24 [Pullulanibacillus camelliae]|uniref:Peptidase M24 n=1 Tax=Pullulanibacillus camelliae TaxID=1707096 RepID=A0A8J2YK05_9BACL|nr:aminopeptidase P family protein [Pullulanibacillus camelliae]GGE49228.1 peptidase M24 [Pullulanibacillus camelliae]
MQDVFQEKCKRIRGWLSERRYDGLLLTSQTSFSWITGGRGFIGIASEAACAKVLITQEHCVLLVNNIEANRLREEEIRYDHLQLKITPWFEHESDVTLLAQEFIKSGAVIVHEEEVANELMQLRYPLTECERQLYHELGMDAAQALELVCRTLQRGEREYHVAGQLAKACYERGIEPTLTLVAADERAMRYRHPLPTHQCIDRYVLIALGARRHGLVASLSRLVHFGTPPEELVRKHQAVTAVDGLFIHLTRPGRAVGDIFEKAALCYEEHGFKDEWNSHHQGGMTGYAGREYRATLKSQEVVGEHQAFAWNPSISGVKSEDTIVIGTEENHILTRTGDFPEVTIHIDGMHYPRPAILQRNDHRYHALKRPLISL